MARESRPLAIGVLQTATLTHDQRRLARAGLAAAANRVGYALLDVVEVAGRPWSDAFALDTIEALKVVFHPRALIAAGAEARQLAEATSNDDLRVIVVPEWSRAGITD